MIPWNDIQAIALGKDNLQLYKYEYNPKNVTVIKSEELKWYPINNN